jgi:hypothetical protein
MKVQFRSLRISAFALALTTVGASLALAETPVSQPSSVSLPQQIRAEKDAQYQEQVVSGGKLHAAHVAPMTAGAVTNDWTSFGYTAK